MTLLLLSLAFTSADMNTVILVKTSTSHPGPAICRRLSTTTSQTQMKAFPLHFAAFIIYMSTKIPSWILVQDIIPITFQLENKIFKWIWKVRSKEHENPVPVVKKQDDANLPWQPIWTPSPFQSGPSILDPAWYVSMRLVVFLQLSHKWQW